MPVITEPTRSERLRIDRHNPTSGRWVRFRDDGHRVRIEIGSTGNRLDPQRRVRISGHDLGIIDRRCELTSWWPVREAATNRVGQFVADLRGELAAAGSPDVDADLAALARAVASLIGRDDEPDVTASVLCSAYPLLRRPVEDGARPEIVPVAVEALLHHDDPRRAARATLGRNVTRPLVRALATALLPDERGHVVWEPVLCALMAAARCGPEQLVSILSTAVYRPGAVRFGVSDVDRARTMFAQMQPRRVAEMLQAALSEPGGTSALQTRIARFDARPPAPPRAPATPTLTTAETPTPALAPARQPGAEELVHPQTWLAVAGDEVAGYQVVLPRTGDELAEWGLAMDNCLGAYQGSVARGHTRIMGLSRNGQLRMAIEISRSRVLRQLETPGNTRPDDATAQTVITFLRDHHLIDADARRLS